MVKKKEKLAQDSPSLAKSVSRETRLRVLIAKPGLDGHDRGAKIICRALKDAGMEVIYTGLRRTPEEIVNAAIQEDVDLIGLSILSGAHNVLFPQIMKLLKRKGAGDIPVIAGGIIPEKDIPRLKRIGLKEIFLPGTSTQEIIRWIQENIPIKKKVRET
ncbi:MAG: cobalamin B12-binding domain-containing protein [Candidatus Aminicenantes bacterium]|nr:cobalamin B12-binding domain-containing protein [Candidatus Aminicenantes bacterium]